MRTVHTEAVPYDVAGTRYCGYLAFDPARGGKRPGVLVCHEGNGLHAEVKVRCHRLAELGYIAFAVDYIGSGDVLETMEAMQAKLASLRADIDGTRDLARAGLDILLARPEVDPARVAAIGYCFGGTFALELARTGAPLRCVVGFHAGLATKRPDDAHHIKAKILVCIGADDPLIPPEERLRFEREMRATTVDWRMNIYGGQVHGFANPGSARWNSHALRYDELTAQRSWRAMRDLFDETFGEVGA
jgi:dienelactone hydrolase